MGKLEISFSEIERELDLKVLDIPSIMAADALLRKKQRVELVPTKNGVKTARVRWETICETNR